MGRAELLIASVSDLLYYYSVLGTWCSAGFITFFVSIFWYGVLHGLY